MTRDISTTGESVPQHSVNFCRGLSSRYLDLHDFAATLSLPLDFLLGQVIVLTVTTFPCPLLTPKPALPTHVDRDDSDQHKSSGHRRFPLEQTSTSAAGPMIVPPTAVDDLSNICPD